MSRITYLFAFCLLLASGQAFAQKLLVQYDRTEPNSIFADKDMQIENSGGSQAGVVISCPDSLRLSFKCPGMTVYTRRHIEGDSVYYLRFIVGEYKGVDYTSQKLEVSSPGYFPLKMPLNLQPSESKQFFVCDSKVGVGCYYRYRDEGQDLFRKAMYEEAKGKYKLALECPDFVPDSEVERRIYQIDSILNWRKMADLNFDLLDYRAAYSGYFKIFSINDADRYVANRMAESQKKLNEDCYVCYDKAENYFKEKNYEKAKELYTRMIAQGCPQTLDANSRLIMINDLDESNRQRASVLTYEYQKDTPIGFSYGKYKDHKSGGYFTLRINKDVFEAMRSNTDSITKPEVNVSFGWTIKIIKPLWIFFGPGYTGVGQYEPKELDENKTTGNPSEDEKLTLNIKSAISPEIGLMVKLSSKKLRCGLALRYTFQYRFALEKESESYIGKTQNVLGIGICF